MINIHEFQENVNNYKEKNRVFQRISVKTLGISISKFLAFIIFWFRTFIHYKRVPQAEQKAFPSCTTFPQLGQVLGEGTAVPHLLQKRALANSWFPHFRQNSTPDFGPVATTG